MKNIPLVLLLIGSCLVSMESPEQFAKETLSAPEQRQKYIIYRDSPTLQALAAADPETNFHTISSIPGIKTSGSKGLLQSNCCKYVSNELVLMLPAMATTACCLYATTNLSCSQGLSVGCGTYLLNVLCLSDENDSLSRETYSGQAALYLKRRLKEKACTIFPCMAPSVWSLMKKFPTKDE